MYAVVHRFPIVRDLTEAARRGAAGLAPLLKRQPGFRGCYIVEFGEGGGSISFFDTAANAKLAHGLALEWGRDNLAEFVDGEPETSMGEVLTEVTA